MRRATVLAGALLLISSAMAQTYYKWTDASGVTHYGEQKPAAVKAQALHLRTDGTGPAPATTAAEPAPADVATDLQAAKSDFRKQACTTARDNLRLLSGRAMVLDTGTVQNPDDITTATKLSTEQRAAAKADAQKQVHQYCDRGW